MSAGTEAGEVCEVADRLPPETRVTILQPALPTYRYDFFERVARRLGEGFSVRYAGGALGILTAGKHNPVWGHELPAMRHLMAGLDWQPGVLSTPLRRGDIVVVSGAPRNVSNMLLLIWARLRGARTIWWGQYWSATSSRRNLVIRLQLMRLADAVIFYTDKEVAAYRTGPGRNDRRLVTALNNGIAVAPIAALRTPYDPARRDKAILFIGRLTAKAMLGLLLQALADDRLADVTLHVVGDGEERTSLRKLAETLGVASQVIWHGGTTEEGAIATVANRCRLFVYPGSVGLSLIHAMAYGLPAILHDDPSKHMPEIAAFEDGETGGTFRYGDTGSLAGAIHQAMVSVDGLKAWSAAGQKAVSETYNTESMAQRMLECITA